MKIVVEQTRFLLGVTFIMVSHFLNAQLAIPCFNPKVNYSVGSNPQFVATSDFNGDGNNDLVLSNFGSNNVSVLLGSNSGTFVLAANYAVGTNPWSVTTADFNGDSNIDLAVSNRITNNVSVLLGIGTGSFLTAVNYSVGTYPLSVKHGDFNGDGNIDLVTANNGSNNISILYGSGTGTFALASNISVGTSPLSVATGDINSDTYVDLVVANSGSNNVSVLLGMGTGSFSTAVNYSVGTVPTSVIFSDLNGDSNFDMAISNQSTNNVSILLGNGNGTFLTAVNYTVGTFPLAITAADFNGDGNIDLATANISSNNVSVLLGYGNGAFSSSFSFTVGTNPRSLVSGDFNNDGKFDIATANSGSNNSTVLLNGIPSIAVNSGSICVGNSFTISPGGANTYTYSGGSAVVSPTTNSTYSVSGTGLNGCISSSCAISNVIVNNAPVITNTISGNQVICAGSNDSYYITPVINALSYVWTLPSEFSGSSTTNTILISSNSNSLAVLTVSLSASNICGASNTQTISIYISTPSSQLSSPQSTICAGSLGSISATDDNANIINYNWSTPTQTICSSINCNTITDSPSLTTTYSLTVTDVNNCSQTYQYTINTVSTPTVLATTNNTLICTGNSATLTASGANTYSWSSGSSSDTEVVSPVSSADYTVTGTDVNGCSNLAVITQSVSLCTGINNIATDNQIINIYPNPTNGILNIETDIIMYNSKIDIYNAFGILVLSERIMNTENSININVLNNGIYLIKIIENDKIVSIKKIVKQ